MSTDCASPLAVCVILCLLAATHGIRDAPVAPLVRRWRRQRLGFNVSNQSSFASATKAYAFAFVGGYHFSGTSLVEQLLSTQEWAVGLREDGVLPHGGKLTSCARERCAAPEHEGVFLTSVFKREKMLKEDAPFCVPKSWANMGDCAEEFSTKSARFAARAISNAAGTRRVRDQLWRDWAPFWRDCSRTTSVYFVEKDIPNLFRVAFFAGPQKGANASCERLTFQGALELRYEIALELSCHTQVSQAQKVGTEVIISLQSEGLIE